MRKILVKLHPVTDIACKENLQDNSEYEFLINSLLNLINTLTKNISVTESPSDKLLDDLSSKFKGVQTESVSYDTIEYDKNGMGYAGDTEYILTP